MRVNMNVKEVEVFCSVRVRKPNREGDVAVSLKDYPEAEVDTRLLWATNSKIHNIIQPWDSILRPDGSVESYTVGPSLREGGSTNDNFIYPARFRRPTSAPLSSARKS